MERVDLERERHGLRQRWRNGGEWDESASKIEVGKMADGRWYVRRYSGRSRWPYRGPRAWAGPHAEHYARATARRWMRSIGGDWVEA